MSLASFISPYAADRDNVRVLHQEAGLQFIECYVATSLNVSKPFYYYFLFYFSISSLLIFSSGLRIT